MLCVDLKNSYYQLPDIHRGLYDLDEENDTRKYHEELLNSSTKYQTILEEKIPCNEFLSDLTKQEQSIGKLLFYTYKTLANILPALLKHKS